MGGWADQLSTNSRIFHFKVDILFSFLIHFVKTAVVIHVLEIIINTKICALQAIKACWLYSSQESTAQFFFSVAQTQTTVVILLAIFILVHLDLFITIDLDGIALYKSPVS